MRPDVVYGLRLLVLPTVALVVIVGGAPGRAELAARIYALIVGGVALVVAIRALRRTDPPETPLRRQGKPADGGRRPPPSLARAEQLTALGEASSFDLQYRFVPLLRAIAAGLLQSRRRIDLDADPEDARRALGDDAWELVRPTRAAPDERTSRGLTAAQLTRVVDALERI